MQVRASRRTRARRPPLTLSHALTTPLAPLSPGQGRVAPGKPREGSTSRGEVSDTRDAVFLFRAASVVRVAFHEGHSLTRHTTYFSKRSFRRNWSSPCRGTRRWEGYEP